MLLRLRGTTAAATSAAATATHAGATREKLTTATTATARERERAERTPKTCSEHTAKRTMPILQHLHTHTHTPTTKKRTGPISTPESILERTALKELFLVSDRCSFASAASPLTPARSSLRKGNVGRLVCTVPPGARRPACLQLPCLQDAVFGVLEHERFKLTIVQLFCCQSTQRSSKGPVPTLGGSRPQSPVSTQCGAAPTFYQIPSIHLNSELPGRGTEFRTRF